MLQLSQSLLRIWVLETTLSNFFLLSSHTAFYTTAVKIQHQFSSVTHSRPHGLQHARPPCPSPTPRVYSNSSPLSRWCHLTISSSVVPFSSCLQSFPASGSFPMSQLFASGGQKNWSFCVSISPSSEYSELISFRINWFDFLAVLGTLKSLLQHPTPKIHKLNLNLQCVGVWRWGFCEVIGFGWCHGGGAQMMGLMPL